MTAEAHNDPNEAPGPNAPAAPDAAPPRPALPSTTFGRPVVAAAAVPPAPRAAPAKAARAPVDVAAVGEKLRARFPAAFTTPPKPLKLRIHADIQQRAPGEFGRHELAVFFSRLTAWGEYLRALADAAHRVDLDGAPVEPVADEHRQSAREELERRRERRQARWTPAAPAAAGARAAAPAREATATAGADARAATAPPPAGMQSAGHPAADGVGAMEAPPPVADRRPDRRYERQARPGRPGGPPGGGERGERRPNAPPMAAPPNVSMRPARSGAPPPRAAGMAPTGPAGRGARPAIHAPATGPVRRPIAHASGRPSPDATMPARSAAPPARDPQWLERARLLRDFEGSPLSAANFCVLKGLEPAALDALLAQARRERDEARRG